jgi:hypothetical protein
MGILSTDFLQKRENINDYISILGSAFFAGYI